MFEREPLAGASEARDHLVRDEQDFIAVTHFAKTREVVIGRRIDAAGTLHRFGDHCRDAVGTFLFDRGDDVIDQEVAAIDAAAASRSHIRSAGVDDVRDRSAKLGLEDLHPGRGGHGDRVAVIGLDAGDDLLLLWSTLLNPVEASGLDVGLVRLGARVGEVKRLHVVVGELDHFLGEPNRGLVGVTLVRVGEPKLRHLATFHSAESPSMYRVPSAP